MTINNRWRVALLALALAGMATFSAQAADLGGNCCADLEERVAELEATTARKGSRKVTLTVYGHVNASILHTDIAGDTHTQITGNPNSQSRVGFTGETRVPNIGVTAGYLLEIGIGSGAGKYPQGTGLNGVADTDLVIRHSAAWIGREGIGRVWIGKTSTATDGIAEIDLTNASIASTMLSLEPLSGTRLAGNNLPFDGGRANVVKFETASFSGFKAAAAWSSADSGSFYSAPTDESWDAALRYSGEGNGFRFAAGAGYRKGADDSKGFMGSASLMHIETGLFVNAAYGDLKGNISTGGTINSLPFAATLTDPRAAHLQVGIERNWLGIGPTTLFGEYMKLEAGSIDTTGWGAGLNQHINAAAMDVYLGYRRYDDMDVTVMTTGAIIRF